METDREFVSGRDEQRDPAASAPAAPQIGGVAVSELEAGRRRAMTPGGLLALHGTAVNRAVTQAIATQRISLPPGRVVLARNAKTDAFAVKGDDLEHLRTTMQQLVQSLDYKTRMTPVGDKTLAIGLVIDDDGDPHIVYTVSQNWINSTLADRAD
jgi:hypothetical protein